MKLLSHLELSFLSDSFSFEFAGRTFTYEEISEFNISNINTHDLSIKSFGGNLNLLQSAISLAKLININSFDTPTIYVSNLDNNKLVISDTTSFSNLILAITNNLDSYFEGIDNLIFGKCVQNYHLSSKVYHYFPINWSVNHSEISSKWKDKDYILDLLSKSPPSQISLSIKNVDQDLYLNEQFLKKLLLIPNCSKFLPFDVLKSKLFAKIVTEDLSIFAAHFNFGIKSLFQKAFEILDIKLGVDSVSSFIDVYAKKQSMSGAENISDECNATYYIISNFLDVESCCTTLIEFLISKRYSPSYAEIIDTVQYFTPRVLKSAVIHSLLRKAYQKCSTNFGDKPLVSVLPSVLISDQHFLKKLLLEEIAFNYDSPIPLLNSSVLKIIGFDLDFFNSLVDISLSNHDFRFTNSLVNLIYDFASNEQRNSKEFYKILIKTDNNKFLAFDSNPLYKQYIYEEDICDYICKVASPKNIGLLPKDFIFNISDKVLIRNILYETPQIGVDDLTPKSWYEDLSLIEPLGRHISKLNLSKKKISNLIKVKSDAIKLVTADPLLLIKLPDIYFKDKEVTLAALTVSSTIIDKIEPSLLMQRDFCLDLLKISSYYSEHIAVSLFYDEEFILKLFKSMDEGEFKFDILSSLPKDLKQFILAYNLSIGGYYDFAKKFINKQKLENQLSLVSKKHFPTKKANKV